MVKNKGKVCSCPALLRRDATPTAGGADDSNVLVHSNARGSVCHPSAQGGKNRRRGKADGDMKRELTFKEDGQGKGLNPSSLPRISSEAFMTCDLPCEPFDEC